jgi:ABC-type Fe3+/spermidine/putrescine transport system ATPase subunit
LREMMQTVGVEHLENRLPRKLSGGEKQRVALARALAVEPDVLLLDEPVSALDEHTRDGICRELKRLQRETGTTTIHVCHNFAEMLAVADRVGIIQQGTLLQVGTPNDVLERPITRQVAEFVQAGNIFTAKAEAEGPWVRLACDCGFKLTAALPEFLAAENQVSQPALEDADDESPPTVSVMVRPENIRLSAANPQHTRQTEDATIIEGSIGEAVQLGPLVEVAVNCKVDAEVTGRLLVSLGKNQYKGLNVEVGDTVTVTISHQDVHVMQD